MTPAFQEDAFQSNAFQVTISDGIIVTGISSAEAFGEPTVVDHQEEPAQIWGGVVVGGQLGKYVYPQVIRAGGIHSAETFGRPLIVKKEIVGPQAIYAVGIQSREALGKPKLIKKEIPGQLTVEDILEEEELMSMFAMMEM